MGLDIDLAKKLIIYNLKQTSTLSLVLWPINTVYPLPLFQNHPILWSASTKRALGQDSTSPPLLRID